MSVLSRVQDNPSLCDANAAYLSDLVTRAKGFVISTCHLPRFPELSQGYSLGRVGGSTDIESIASSSLLLSVNGSSPQTATIATLPGLTSGSLIAAELQSTIRALGPDDWGTDEVTVTESTGQYTITSGRYGEASIIAVTFGEDDKHLCQALSLSPVYGGTELPGMAYSEGIESLTVAIVEVWFNRLDLEGFQSGELPHGFNWTADGLPREIISALITHRRLL